MDTVRTPIRWKVQNAVLIILCLGFASSARCQPQKLQAVRETSAELRLAKAQYIIPNPSIARNSATRNLLRGLHKDIAVNKEFNEERTSGLESAFQDIDLKQHQGTIRNLLALSLSRRERLQGRTRQTAREQRWVRAKKAKERDSLGLSNAAGDLGIRDIAARKSNKGKGQRKPRHQGKHKHDKTKPGTLTLPFDQQENGAY